MMRKTLLLLVAAGLSACTLGPDYTRPDIKLPESKLNATLLSNSQQKALAQWWMRYQDPVLNGLIADALDDNLDIALQVARLREARAQFGLARSNLFPTLDAQAQAARQETSGAVNSFSGTSQNGQGQQTGSDSLRGSGTTFNFFSIAASLSYELDVFGGLRRASQAARAALLASAYTQDSIRLGVVSDVVTNYMSLRAIERQIHITKGTIRSREKGLKLDKKRHKYGAIDKLTLSQTRSLLDAARAQLPPLKQQRGQLSTSLAILTGKTPRQIIKNAKIKAGTFDDIHTPDKLPALLPSQLIDRRPDIRSAEASLISANANIGVAKARFFPTFNLSAMVGSETLTFDDLFTPFSRVHSFSGAITAPIFEFGRNQARYETAIARKDEAKIMYRQTIRQAFREVRLALITIKLTQDRLDAVQRQVGNYRNTLELAKTRYRSGRNPFFDVLDAQRQLYSSQLELAEALRDRYTATADLFKALGGGWTENSDALTGDLEKARDRYTAPEQSGKPARVKPPSK